VPEDLTGEERFRARVLAELATCGIASDNVSIQYENELQDFSIRIQAAAPKLDQGQLVTCEQADFGVISQMWR
jgi:hypothetical protein